MPRNPTQMRNHRKFAFLLPALLVAACSTTPENPEDEGSAPVPPTAPAAEAAAPAPAMQEPGTQEIRDELEVRRQKRALLAREFLAQADDAFRRGDYRRARLLYADAFQMDPNSREARDGLRRAEAALGGEGWDLSSAEDVAEQQQLRWARERLRVEALLREGDRHMLASDYAAAVEAFRAGELALEFSPNLAGAELDLSLFRSRREEAERAWRMAEEAARQAERDAAAEEAEQAEEARQNYFETRINTLFTEANTRFELGFYGDAVRILDDLLELDPRNEQARDLREVANEAWHEQRQRRTAGEFREQWRRTFEELRALAVPPQSTIEFDVDRWRNEVLQRQPLDRTVEKEAMDPVDASIQQALDSTRIEPRFDNMLVEEVVDNLAAYTRGVNFVVSRAVREDLDEDVKTVNLVFQKPLPVSGLLRIIEDQTGGEVRFVVRNGVVNVLTSEEAAGGQITLQYEVRDIVRKVQDFPGTEINLAPSGGIDVVDEELPEKEATILTEDELLEAITENISPDAWDDTATVSVENGTLIVWATPEIHDQVRALLDDLRKASNIMVEIKVRFLKVEDSFLQDVGVDFRGLGDDSTAGKAGMGADNVFDDFGSDPGSPSSPGTIGTGNDSGVYFREASDNVNVIARTEHLYDAGLGSEDTLIGSGGLSLQYTLLDDTQVEMILRAVEKSKRSEVVTESKLMVYNTARANLTVANQVSYVGDFDVEIAQAAAIADPIVRVAQDGVFLDVRPVVTADRRFTYIEVRPTVANLVRPIPTFQTSLGAGSPVTLQLPELEIQKIRTRVLVPDGGTLLLGGLNVVNQQDLESGIPFLNRIPILSFFFSRKGTFESYQKLIILLTARVIIPSEYEPSATPGGLAG